MLFSVLAMSIMGVLFGLGLAFASKIFRVQIDPKIEGILSSLPGANCGACGKAGCAGLAEAIAKGDSSLTSCPVAGEEGYTKIAEILGIEKKPFTKKIANLHCGGGRNAKDKYEYVGEKTCAGANLLLKGQKECKYACLGFGDCVSVCPFDAIHMGEEGVPIVWAQRCTGCGKCIRSCPKNIITLDDVSHRYMIKCLSQDKTSFTKFACKVGCIGCKICEKLSGGVFFVENNLSRIDYSRAASDTPWEECVKKCPTKCIERREA